MPNLVMALAPLHNHNELQKPLHSIETLIGKTFLSFKIELFKSFTYSISTPPFNF